MPGLTEHTALRKAKLCAALRRAFVRHTSLAPTRPAPPSAHLQAVEASKVKAMASCRSPTGRSCRLFLRRLTWFLMVAVRWYSLVLTCWGWTGG